MEGAAVQALLCYQMCCIGIKLLNSQGPDCHGMNLLVLWRKTGTAPLVTAGKGKHQKQIHSSRTYFTFKMRACAPVPSVW